MPTATVTPRPTPATPAAPPVTAWVGATRLTAAKQIQYEDRFNDLGSAEFTIQNTAATVSQRALITFGTRVEFREFGQPAFVMLVESISQVTTSTEEAAGQATTYSGRSILAELEGSVLYPASGIYEVASGPLATLKLGRAPIEDVRYWNFATVDLDRSGWGTPIDFVAANQAPPLFPPLGYAGGPAGHPDPPAEWIVPASIAVGGYHSPRTWYVARAFTSSACFSIDVFAAAGVNDSFEVWIDGVPVISAESKDGRKLHRANVGVTDGSHLLVAKIVHGGGNDAGNITGFICSIFKHYDDGGGLVLAPLARTGSGTWQSLDNPSSPPGFTAAAIARDVVTEAIARGPHTAWDFGFTDTADSASQAPLNASEFSAKVGTGTPQVLRELAEDFGEFANAPAANSGRRLNWWSPKGDAIPGGGTATGRGTASGVTLQPGVNVLEMSHHDTLARATAVLARWEEGHLEVPDAAAIAEWSRREAFFSIPEILEGTAAAYSTGRQLQVQSQPARSIDNLKHYLSEATQYRVGDTVTAPDRAGTLTTWRVMARAVTLGDGAVAFVTSQLGVARDAEMDRVDRQQRKLIGTFEGQSERAQITSPSVITSETVEPKKWTFSTGGSGVTIAGDRGTPQRPDGPTLIVRFEIETDVPGLSGSTTARVEVNGTSIGTVSLASGADFGMASLGTGVLVNRSDSINIETTAAGGAQGITVTVIGCPAD